MRRPPRRSTRSSASPKRGIRSPRPRRERCAGTSTSMDSSPTSERLRVAVRGRDDHPGLAAILPRLQHTHRRELRRLPHWSKEELVRHPEPRELIRSMRKPGNLDAQGRPVYTLDERRVLTADVYENRMVRAVVEDTRWRLRRIVRMTSDPEASQLLRELDA